MNRSKNSGLKYNMDDKIFAMPSFFVVVVVVRNAPVVHVSAFYNFFPSSGKIFVLPKPCCFLLSLLLVLSKGGVI